ncbi:hypothetical protein RJ639_047506 [Escallonia herrerae]|uniref:RING-CH-type domain-containing protein n=1 Tax=Escallonia herrerae TaxID=1293975 RepID=A0AA88W6D9_9ASTE|nr:hypothetical protein RJ639_047506 [Escallonia herrerae]
MTKENFPRNSKNEFGDEGSSPIASEDLRAYPAPRHSTDKEAGLATCRVCQCVESDKRGDAALDFLGIAPVTRNSPKRSEDVNSKCNNVLKDVESDCYPKNARRNSGFIEFVSPDGEVFVCSTDIEMGFDQNQDILIELGCSCKNDLALVHYACALKWFVNHGSTVCEICGGTAKNIKTADLKKVLGSLKEYEMLRERTVNGIPDPAPLHMSSGVDPDAVAAIRRQRLSEISLWFGQNNSNYSAADSQAVAEQTSTFVAEQAVLAENPAAKWAVEGTGILLATGLLTVILAWLIAPRVGKVLACIILVRDVFCVLLQGYWLNICPEVFRP